MYLRGEGEEAREKVDSDAEEGRRNGKEQEGFAGGLGGCAGIWIGKIARGSALTIGIRHTRAGGEVLRGGGEVAVCGRKEKWQGRGGVEVCVACVFIRLLHGLIWPTVCLSTCLSFCLSVILSRLSVWGSVYTCLSAYNPLSALRYP